MAGKEKSQSSVPAKMEEQLPVLGGKFGKFEIVKADPEALAAVRENVGEGQLTQFDLDRVKIPSGGGIAWEIPGEGEGGEPDVVKEFEALILHAQDQRAYWEKSLDETGGGTPPECSSSDAVTGEGEPGGECSSCQFSKFGTARPRQGQDVGKGQACRQIKLMFLIRPSGILPIVLALPPTSLKACKQYMLRLGSKGIPYYGTLTKFKLTKESGDGIEYSVVQMSPGERLTPEQVEVVKALRSQLLPAIKRSVVRSDDFVEAPAAREADELPAM